MEAPIHPLPLSAITPRPRGSRLAKGSHLTMRATGKPFAISEFTVRCPTNLIGFASIYEPSW
jgi:hypothetical protein